MYDANASSSEHGNFAGKRVMRLPVYGELVPRPILPMTSPRECGTFAFLGPGGSSIGSRASVDCRTDHAGRRHEQGTQSCDETIRCPETRRPLPGTIQDQELLLDENGLGDHGTDPGRTRESRRRNDNMDEKDDQIAPLSIAARTGGARDWSKN
jgi:hypothetical protein